MDFFKVISKFFENAYFIMSAIALLAFCAYYLSFSSLYKMLSYRKICAKKESFFSAYDEVFSKSEDVDIIKENFASLRANFFDKLDSRLRFSLALSAVAPLLGLLGTISGLGHSLGGILDNSSAVSQGISKALYTTQAGLSLALPVFVIVLVAKFFKQRILINISKYEISLLRQVR